MELCIGAGDAMRITFYYPKKAISLTEHSCAQMCEHCRGKALEGMLAPRTSSELYEMAKDEQEVLLSGGNFNGRVPWHRFENGIRALKEKGTRIAMHPGMIGEQDIKELEALHIDQVLVDFILDDCTLEENYHAPYNSKDIKRMVESLIDSEIEVVPHVLYGLEPPEKSREEIRALADYGMEKLVLIFLVSDKRLEGLESFLEFTRENFEGTLAIGCMRGREKEIIDPKAVELGFNRIVLPTKDAMKLAESRGYETEIREGCCSFP
jgi:hypothetical protein